AAGGTIYINDGVYFDANLAIGHAMTLDGESRGGVVIHSAMVDGHADASFDPTASNGLIVRSDDVTVEDLTIDGGANQDFRNAIVTDFNNGAFNNLHLDDLAIENIYRKGVNISATGANHTTGNRIVNSVFDHIGAAAALGFEGAFAIAVFQSDTLIDNNVITNSAGGIGSNYLNTESQPPHLTAPNNQISP